MSNETMTDAQAIEAVCAAMPDEVPLDASLGLSHIAARLRGEAAQGEQQAVYQWREYGRWHDLTEREYQLIHADPGNFVRGETIVYPEMTRKLYTRPQPVTGDVVPDWFERLIAIVGKVEASTVGAAAMWLARRAASLNAEHIAFNLKGVTSEGEDIGDWQITVSKPQDAAPAAPEHSPPYRNLLSGDLEVFASQFPQTAERIRRAIYSTQVAVKADANFTAAAPAPVAGDAVSKLPPDVQQMIATDDAAWALAKLAESFGAERDEDDDSTWWVLRIDHFRALTQDRASQAREPGTQNRTVLTNEAMAAAQSAKFRTYRDGGDMTLEELLREYGAHHAVDINEMFSAVLGAAFAASGGSNEEANSSKG